MHVDDKTKYIFNNILWCFDKPYSRDEVIKAAITTSHFIVPNRHGDASHNKRQKIRYLLCKSKNIEYKLNFKGDNYE